MAIIKCPTCGTAIDVVEKKSGVSGWVVGCIVAGCAVPIVVFFIGLLAAIAIPNFIRSREMSQRNACVANLQMITEAKAQVALEKSSAPGDVLTEEEVSRKLPNGLTGLTCHKGGRYTLNPAGKEPDCSVHGTITTENLTPYGSAGGNRSP